MLGPKTLLNKNSSNEEQIITEEIKKLGQNFNNIYNQLTNGTNFENYHQLITIWKPLVSLLLNAKLSSEQKNITFWESKQKLLTFCPPENLVLRTLINSINYNHVITHLKDPEILDKILPNDPSTIESNVSQVNVAEEKGEQTLTNASSQKTPQEELTPLFKIRQLKDEITTITEGIAQLFSVHDQLFSNQRQPHTQNYCDDSKIPFQELVDTLSNQVDKKKKEIEILLKKMTKGEQKKYQNERKNEVKKIQPSQKQLTTSKLIPSETTVAQSYARVFAENPKLLRHIIETSFLWQEILTQIRKEGADEPFLTLLRNNKLTLAADFITTPDDTIREVLDLENNRLEILTVDNIFVLEQQLKQDPYNRLLAYQLAQSHFLFGATNAETASKIEKFNTISGEVDDELKQIIALIKAKNDYLEIRKKIIFYQNIKKLQCLSRTLIPKNDLIVMLEPSITPYLESTSIENLLKNLQTQCFTILNTNHSTDLRYISAYYFLDLIQSGFDKAGLERPSEWAELTPYKNRVYMIQTNSATLDLADNELLKRLHYFEEEKAAIQKQDKHDTIESFNNFLEKNQLTYQNSTTREGEEIFQKHAKLAELLQNALTEIMASLPDHLQQELTFQLLLIKLWEICRFHHEMNDRSSEQWLKIMENLRLLCEESSPTYTTQRIDFLINEKNSKNMAKIGAPPVLTLNPPVKKKGAITKQPIKNPALSPSLQAALSVATEADILCEAFYQFDKHRQEFDTFCRTDTSEKISKILTQIYKKYRSARKLLCELSLEENKQFTHELTMFTAYVNVQLSTSDNRFCIDEKNYDAILKVINFDADLKNSEYRHPFENDQFRQYQYNALMKLAEVIAKNNDEEIQWKLVVKIYKALEKFQEADLIKLINFLRQSYQKLFQITQNTHYQEQAVDYGKRMLEYGYGENEFGTHVQEIIDNSEDNPLKIKYKFNMLLLNLIKEIIRSPKLLKLLLENGYIWQSLLAQLRQCPYDAHLVELFKKYNLDEALVFLTKSNEAIKNEIQPITIPYDFNTSLEAILQDIQHFQAALQQKPYDISIIYQLIHAYLQKERILEESGKNSPENIGEIIDLNTIFDAAIPSLKAQLLMVKLRGVCIDWTANLPEEKILTLAQILKLTVGNKKIVLSSQKNHWEIIQDIFQEFQEHVAQQYSRNAIDYITELEFYRLMTHCYNEKLTVTPQESEKTVLIESLNHCTIKIQEIAFKDANRDLNCIDTSKQNNTMNQHWITVLNNPNVTFEDNDPYIMQFKAGLASFENSNYLDALSSFSSIIHSQTPPNTTEEKYRLLCDDIYFLMAESIRLSLVELNLTTVDNNVIQLWKQLWKTCRTYYTTVLKQNLPLHCDAAKANLAEVLYHFGKSLEANKEFSIAKVVYEEFLKNYQEDHRLFNEVQQAVNRVSPAAKTLTDRTCAIHKQMQSMQNFQKNSGFFGSLPNPESTTSKNTDKTTSSSHTLPKK